MAGRGYSKRQYRHRDSHHYPQGGAIHTTSPYTFSPSQHNQTELLYDVPLNSSIQFTTSPMSHGSGTNVLFQSDSGSSFTSFGQLSFSPSPSPVPFSSDVSSGLGSRSNSIPSLSGSSPSFILSPIPHYPHSIYTTLKQNSRPNDRNPLTYKKLPPLTRNDYKPHLRKDTKQQPQQASHNARYKHEEAIISHTTSDTYKPNPQDKTTSCSKPVTQTEDQVKPHAQKVRPLGPIRRVRDTVTGDPEYSLDPLCPSNMDFQRRAKDEAAKFFHKVIDYASTLGEKINYEDPETREKGGRGITQDSTRVLGKYSLDFRWQMKHLHFNRTVYSTVVFYRKIPEKDISDITQHLRHVADCLAHQQNLTDNYRHRNGGKKMCGTTQCIEEFFNSVIEFVEKVELNIRHTKIEGLNIHRKNLQDIYDTFHEYLKYRKVHQHNLIAFQDMDKTIRKQKLREIVEILANKIEEDESDEWQEMIAVRIAAHINFQL